MSHLWECSNRKCRWIGPSKEKTLERLDDRNFLQVCPKCGEAAFYEVKANPLHSGITASESLVVVNETTGSNPVAPTN